MNNTENKQNDDIRLMKGNEALAEAAIRADMDGYFGYPITPQSEVLEYFEKEVPKRGGQVLQAESEVASINMIYELRDQISSRKDVVTPCMTRVKKSHINTAPSRTGTKLKLACATELR